MLILFRAVKRLLLEHLRLKEYFIQMLQIIIFINVTAKYISACNTIIITTLGIK